MDAGYVGRDAVIARRQSPSGLNLVFKFATVYGWELAEAANLGLGK